MKQLLGLCLLLVLSCGDESERFERIEKLRGIGVKTSTPVVLTPALGEVPKTVEVVFYLALPLGQTLDKVEFLNQDSGAYAEFISGELTSEPVYKDIGALQLVEVQGRVAVPPLSAEKFAAFRGLVRLRYGIHVESGSEKEDMLAEVRVVADPSNEILTWKPHTLSITTPEESLISTDDKEISGTLTKDHDEPVRLRWFVSSGKVKNSQALSSTWSEMTTGKQTLILAYYSKKSLFFDFVTKTVEVQ